MLPCMKTKTIILYTHKILWTKSE